MGKLSSRLRSRARNARRSIQSESKDMAERMRKHAIRLTSGSIPKSDIQRYHFFARYSSTTTQVFSTGRRPNSRKKMRVTARGMSAPLLPINKHDGTLQRSLRVIRVGEGYRLFFTSPFAKYILRTGGTKWMVDRGFWHEMQKLASNERKRAAKNVSRALRKR
ncbi:MAG: hypothetical protein JST12_14675 [Armatimonadetes bacterium]|nr:hypothetical protein [Armatimonadota bacterium]